MTPDQKYMISFDIAFTKNPRFNEDPLVNLLNSFARSQAQSFEEVLLRHYEDLFDLVQQFGMGMIVFPTLVAHLAGSYSIQSVDLSESP